MPPGYRRLLRDALGAERRDRAGIVLATAASAVLGAAMIGGALFWLFSLAAPAAEMPAAEQRYTLEELARHDGVEGRDCLVAVDGDVYLIEGFALWSMGRHTPSGGRARCGLDLTEVIDESPHGKSKLRLLEQVGALKVGGRAEGQPAE